MKAQTYKFNPFTIIELLVVISIIAILLTLLMPTLSRSRELAKSAVCKVNLKQSGVALYAFAKDSKEAFPPPFKSVAAGGGVWGENRYWYCHVREYLDLNFTAGVGYQQSGTVLNCPTTIYPDEIMNFYEKASYIAVRVFFNTKPLEAYGNIKLADISTPGDTGYISDGYIGDAHPAEVRADYNGTPGIPSSFAYRLRPRHPDNSANILFFDGHVSIKHADPATHESLEKVFLAE